MISTISTKFPPSHPAILVPPLHSHSNNSPQPKPGKARSPGKNQSLRQIKASPFPRLITSDGIKRPPAIDRHLGPRKNRAARNERAPRPGATPSGSYSGGREHIAKKEQGLMFREAREAAGSAIIRFTLGLRASWGGVSTKRRVAQGPLAFSAAEKAPLPGERLVRARPSL